ncbi:MAG: hypothetical protein Ct9H300mP11_21350 [Chloroflexota bacterium]|nr:MAG: hypothetical protein Ct9H300mP11_21350 [Chloroflexota bacterium]
MGPIVNSGCEFAEARCQAIDQLHISQFYLQLFVALQRKVIEAPIVSESSARAETIMASLFPGNRCILRMEKVMGNSGTESGRHIGSDHYPKDDEYRLDLRLGMLRRASLSITRLRNATPLLRYNRQKDPQQSDHYDVHIQAEKFFHFVLDLSYCGRSSPASTI